MLKPEEAVVFANDVSERLAQAPGWNDVAGRSAEFASGEAAREFNKLLAELALLAEGEDVVAVTHDGEAGEAKVLTSNLLIDITLSIVSFAEASHDLRVSVLHGLVDLQLTTETPLATTGSGGRWPGRVRATFGLADGRQVTLQAGRPVDSEGIVDTLRGHWMAGFTAG